MTKKINKTAMKGRRRRGFCTIAGNNLTPAGFPQIFTSFRWLHSDSHSALVSLANFTYFLLIALRFSLRLWSHLYFWNILPSSSSAVTPFLEISFHLHLGILFTQPQLFPLVFWNINIHQDSRSFNYKGEMWEMPKMWKKCWIFEEFWY